MADPNMVNDPSAPAPDAAPVPDNAIPPAADMPDNQDHSIQPASPEEEEQRKHFKDKAEELVYNDDKTFASVVDLLDGGADGEDGGDPIKGLAMAAEMVFARVAQAAEEGGEQLQPATALQCGIDLIEDLAEVSMTAKIHDFSKDRDGLEAAFFQAMDLFKQRLEKAGELDNASAKADFDKLMAMDQNGTLQKIMQDLSANDEAGQAGAHGDDPNAEAVPPTGKTKGFDAALQQKGAA